MTFSRPGFAVAILFGVCGPMAVAQTPAAPAAAAASRPLPTDPAVRTGTLPNGLRYYVRKNGEPHGRAELRLVINAGSLQEDDSQRGLAHFIEHMAFNGTTHFPKNKLVDYLESIGMGFGADINASTGFDETVYRLTIPTDSTGFLENGLLVLQDWAQGIALDSTEIDRERGVVVEEWRTRRGAGMRVVEQQLPVTFGGSRYASRLPIGLVDVVKTAPRSELKRFYDEWYRPDLMAVVVVGDVDDAKVEAMIKSRFATVTPRTPHPRARTDVTIAPNAAPQVSIVTDPEITTSSFTVMHRGDNPRTFTVADYRRDMISGFFATLVNQRLGEIADKPDAPFVGAGIGVSRLGRTGLAYTAAGRAKDGQIEGALRAVLTELVRVRQFGLTPTELDRQKTNTLRAIENAEQRREKTPSASYADAYVSSFLNGEPFHDEQTMAAIARAIVPTITVDEVNRVVGQYVTDSNRVMLVTAPRKDGISVPTQRTLFAAYDSGMHAAVTAYADVGVSDAPFLPAPPVPGKVVREVRDSATGIVDWTLSNGVRVLVKQTNFTPDVVSISGTRPGGTSLAPDSLLVPAMTAAQVVAAGGLGTFDTDALRKRLTGKSVQAGTSIDRYAEEADATATPADLETALQLLYLGFTAPRADTLAFRRIVQNALTSIANRSASPEAAFGDTITVTMSQHHPRVPLVSEALIGKMALAKSMSFYRNQFKDASGFTFVIVGVMSPDSLKPLIETYLGGLPSSRRTHTFADLGIKPPTGVVKKAVYRGREQKSITQLVFTGDAQDTPETRARLTVLRGVLTLRLLETLREKLGGTYTPQVGAGLDRVPHESYRVSIGFSAEPKRVPELERAVFDEIAKLQHDGALPADLQKVKEELRRDRETALRTNGFWESAMQRYAQWNRPFAAILTDDRYAQSVTAEQLRDAARAWLRSDNYMMFTLYPETPATGSTGAGTRPGGE